MPESALIIRPSPPAVDLSEMGANVIHAPPLLSPTPSPPGLSHENKDGQAAQQRPHPAPSQDGGGGLWWIHRSEAVFLGGIMTLLAGLALILYFLPKVRVAFIIFSSQISQGREYDYYNSVRSTLLPNF